jgi:hypothetical protein
MATGADGSGDEPGVTTGIVGISALAAALDAFHILKARLGQGGTFDYQRRRYNSGKNGYTQLRQFRDVSNFNVGLLCQQAGLSRWATLRIAGEYAQ